MSSPFTDVDTAWGTGAHPPGQNDLEDRATGGLEILSKANAVISELSLRGELAAAQIAELVDEPLSSTYRLLTSLIAIGWVDAGTRRGMYRLGLHFMHIGGQVEDQIDVRQVALPSMTDLCSQKGVTSLLCVPRGRMAVCIERVNGSRVLSQAVRIGDRLPMHTGALPMTILAFSPDAEREAVLAAYLDTAGAVARESVLVEAAVIRSRGYAVSDSGVTAGIAAIGAPVFNHRGELEASVGVSGLSREVLDHVHENARKVVDAAAKISVGLGWMGAVSGTA